MIRYLEQEEKSKSRPLWESVFKEDSPEFVDFYYREKTKTNKILAAWEDDGIVAMLHRNPYDVVVRDRIWRIDYVAGVATDPERRHRGYMRRLLNQMFSDQYAAQMPFCFLVPASADIYLPFDFTYISNLPQNTVRENGPARLEKRPCSGDPKDYAGAAGFANRLLEQEYEVYTKRDEGYYRSLCQEVRSAEGDLLLIRERDEKERLAGIYAYYGGGEPEVRELLCLPEYRKVKGEPRPAVMGRIIHLEKFVQAVRLKEDSLVEAMEMIIQVRDPLIAGNNGVFLWQLNKGGSLLKPQAGKDSGMARLSMEISELSGWLFGYRKPEFSEGMRESLENIQTLQGVYFDEIV